MADLSDEAMKQLQDQFEAYSEGAFQAKDFSNAISQVAQQVEKAVMNQSTYNSIIKTQLALEKTSLSNIKRKNELHRQELSIYARLIPVLDATYRNNRRLAESQRQTISQLEEYIDQMDRSINSERRRSDAIKEFGRALKDVVVDITKFTLVLTPFAVGIAGLKGIYNAVKASVVELNAALANTASNFGMARTQMEDFGGTITSVRSQWAAYGITISEINKSQQELINAFYDTGVASEKGLVSSTTLLQKIGLSASESAELVRSLSQQFQVQPEAMEETIKSFSGMVSKGTSLSMLYRDMAASSSLFALRNNDSMKSLAQMSEYSVRTGQSTQKLVEFGDNLVFNAGDALKNLGKIASQLGGNFNLNPFRGMLETLASTGLGQEQLQRYLLGFWEKAKESGKAIIPEIRRAFEFLFQTNTENIDKMLINQKKLDEERTKGIKPTIKTFQELISAGMTFDQMISALLDTFAARLGTGTEEIEKSIQSILTKAQSVLNKIIPSFRELKEAFNLAGGQDNFLRGVVGAARAFLRPIRNYWQKELKPKLKEAWEDIRPVLKNMWETDFAPTIKNAWNNDIKPLIKDSLKWAWSEAKPIMEESFRALEPILSKIFTKLSTLIGEEISVLLWEAGGKHVGLGFSREDVNIFRKNRELAGSTEENIKKFDEFIGEINQSTEDRLKIMYMNEPLAPWAKKDYGVISTPEKIPQQSMIQLGEELGRGFRQFLLENADGAVKREKEIFGYATGGVFNRPTLAMIGEEGRDEVVIPTGRIREGLPINSAVASQLSSIGVPGFANGAVVSYSQYAATFGGRSTGVSLYGGAGDPAQIRKRDAEMRRQNENYLEDLKKQHRDIFEQEMRLFRYNRRTFRRLGRDIGIFGRYTKVISNRLRNIFEVGTLEDAIATGLGKYFETEKWQDGVRAGMDEAMKNNGFIYQNIKNATSNVTAEATQGGYRAFRRWEEGGMEGGIKEGARLTGAGIFGELATTRYSEGDFKGYTFGEKLGMQLFGQDPSSVKNNSSHPAAIAAKAEKQREEQRKVSEKQKELAEQQRELAEKEAEENKAVREIQKTQPEREKTLQSKKIQNDDKNTQALMGALSEVAKVVGSGGNGSGGGGTGGPAAASGPAIDPAKFILQKQKEKGVSTISPEKKPPGMRIQDIPLKTFEELEPPPPPPSAISKWLSKTGSGFKSELGAVGTQIPGMIGQSAVSGVYTALATGDPSQGVDAFKSSLEQGILGAAMSAGPYGQAAAVGYMALKGFMKNRQRKAKEKKERKKGRESVSKDLGIGGSFHNALKRTGMFPQTIPLEPPGQPGDIAFETYMDDAEKHLKSSIKNVYGKYLSESDIQNITNSYLSTGGLDPVYAQAYLDKAIDRAKTFGMSTKFNSLGVEVIDPESTGVSFNVLGSDQPIGTGYNRAQINADNNNTNLGGGITQDTVENAYTARAKAAGINPSMMYQGNTLVDDIKKGMEGVNITVEMDGRKVGKMVTDRQSLASNGL